jgi:hypothetical protein
MDQLQLVFPPGQGTDQGRRRVMDTFVGSPRGLSALQLDFKVLRVVIKIVGVHHPLDVGKCLFPGPMEAYMVNVRENNVVQPSQGPHPVHKGLLRVGGIHQYVSTSLIALPHNQVRGPTEKFLGRGPSNVYVFIQELRIPFRQWSRFQGFGPLYPLDRMHGASHHRLSHLFRFFHRPKRPACHFCEDGGVTRGPPCLQEDVRRQDSAGRTPGAAVQDGHAPKMLRV